MIQNDMINVLVGNMLSVIAARGEVKYLDALRSGQAKVRKRFGKKVGNVKQNDVLRRLCKRDVEMIKHGKVYCECKKDQKYPASTWSLYMRLCPED